MEVPYRSIIEKYAEKHPIGRDRAPNLESTMRQVFYRSCEVQFRGRALTVTLLYMGPFSEVWMKRKTTAGISTRIVMTPMYVFSSLRRA